MHITNCIASSSGYFIKRESSRIFFKAFNGQTKNTLEVITMKFIEMVNGLPKRENHKLNLLLKEFVRMNVKVAKVDLDKHEYKSTTVARSVISNACKRHCVPVRTKIVDGILYLVRTDME